MVGENQSYLRIAAGSAAVIGGGFVVFQFALERGAEVDAVVWTAVAWASLLIMGAALTVGAVGVAGYLWQELRGQGTRVKFTAENGPGVAQIRIRNCGRPDALVATATVLDVQERVNNPRFLRSFNLFWMGAGGPRAELSTGSLDTVQIATAETVEGTERPFDRELLELKLWGWEGGGLKARDWFRWNGGDADAVVITVAVEVFAQRSRRPARAVFVLKNIPYGGVAIQTKD